MRNRLRATPGRSSRSRTREPEATTSNPGTVNSTSDSHGEKDQLTSFKTTFDVHSYAARNIAWNLLAAKIHNFKVFLYHKDIHKGRVINLSNTVKALVYGDKISPVTFLFSSNEEVSSLKVFVHKACGNVYLRRFLLKTPEGDVYLNENTLYPFPLLSCPLLVISKDLLNCPSQLVKKLDSLLKEFHEHGLDPRTENLSSVGRSVKSSESNLKEHMYKTNYFEDSSKRRRVPPLKNRATKPNSRQRAEARVIAQRWSARFTARYGQPVEFTWRTVFGRTQEEVFQATLYLNYYSYQTTVSSQAEPQLATPPAPCQSEEIRDPRLRKRQRQVEIPSATEVRDAVAAPIPTPPSSPERIHPYCERLRPPTPPRGTKRAGLDEDKY
ncbi:hypothetical protein QAD02_004213 [Eretmocerus hayati]|uniref:Uncharacterized protein n=1 Tax=Eretmocerus hayati TaxID=131215 RepID=A0ACC2NPC0_9HYME|nr:hypothetical protein QAD02_004213 [Eretmocerus hayati]